MFELRLRYSKFMEGKLLSGNMMPVNGYCGNFDLQGPVRVHHHQHLPAFQRQHHSHPSQGSPMVPPTIHENFALSIGSTQACDHPVSLAGYNKSERGKSVSDEDEPSFMEDAGDGCDDQRKGKKASGWHRVKWTDTMVRLLITAVSYINEEAASGCGSGARRKYANFQKKGKWKSVSKVMAERGHFVSPQQCEDKFNDLNKRYKRLNEIIGRGASCEVVENPALLDVMDHISEKAKEEVRKILSSKHLHYEEMCSYHNENKLHLPPDPELQRSLRIALRSKEDRDDGDAKSHPHDDNDEVDQEAELDDHDDFEENQALTGDHRSYGIPGRSAKRVKLSESYEDFSFRNSLISLDCKKDFKFQAENAGADVNQAPPEGTKVNTLQKLWMNNGNLQLEEQRLQIEVQMLELEKERFKWQRFCHKKDQELEMRRMEIERMKLENERMALELRRKEMGLTTMNLAPLENSVEHLGFTA